MHNIIFELGANLFQALMFIGTLYFFFDKKYDVVANIVLFFSFVIINFAVFTYFILYPPFFHLFDMVLYITIYEIYVFVALKGNTVFKVIMPFVLCLINTVISYAFLYSTSFFTKMTFEQLSLQSSVYRYICVVLVNLTNLLFFIIMVKLRRKSYELKSASNVISFVGIPLVAMVIVYSTLYILILTDYQSNILPFLMIICIGMSAIAIIVWYMISRISKDNDIKTKLLLIKQRADLYETNILDVNTQIEEMSKVKHDIKNNISCIDKLIRNKEYEKAELICSEIIDRMKNIYTPMNTDNPTLNAVLNVELEKAKNNGIKFKVEVTDSMIGFASNTDLISIIGNICDNAIEYLSRCPFDLKEMSLSILKHNTYCIITCKNKLLESVLYNNPKLETNKDDKLNHGKGVSIIKDIVKKYNGNLNYIENKGEFIVTVILQDVILPEIK